MENPQPQQFYRYQPENGFMPIPDDSPSTVAYRQVFSGQMLCALANYNFEKKYRPAMKQLIRTALGQLLAGKTIKSRALFTSFSANWNQNLKI